MFPLLLLFDVIYSPFPQLAPGLVGGLLGAIFGMVIKNETWQWVVSFSLLGIFSAYAFLLLNATDNFVYLYPDVLFFVLLYAIIGFVGGVIYRKFTNDIGWHKLAMFCLLGVICAFVYQSKGPVLRLYLVGAVIGVIIWYVTNPRVHYAILLGAAGAVLSWTLFAASYAFQSHFLVFVLGGVLGTFAGWHILDSNLRWAVALIILGAMSGSVMEAMYWWFGIIALVIGAIVGGVVGLVVSQLRQRSAVTFAIFGGLFLVFILSAIKMIEFSRILDRLF